MSTIINAILHFFQNFYSEFILALAIATVAGLFWLFKRVFGFLWSRFLWPYNWVEKIDSTLIELSGTQKSMLDIINSTVERQKKLAANIEDISKEFYSNGGGSMKDALTRIEHNQKITRGMFNSFMDQQQIAIRISDFEGDCIWANNKYLELTGLRMEEVLGKGWISAVDIRDRDLVKKEWLAAFEEHRSFQMTYRIRSHNGIIHCVNCRAFPLVASTLQRTDWISYLEIINTED